MARVEADLKLLSEDVEGYLKGRNWKKADIENFRTAIYEMARTEPDLLAAYVRRTLRFMRFTVIDDVMTDADAQA